MAVPLTVLLADAGRAIGAPTVLSTETLVVLLTGTAAITALAWSLAVSTTS